MSSSYYLAIVGTKDNPIFEHEFGTSKHGGDGIARFPEQARHMNQFIVHSSLDIVEEVQWGTGLMYLKVIDRFYNNYVSCFLTGGNIKFLLLHAPNPTASTTSSVYPPSSSSLGITSSSSITTSNNTNTTSSTTASNSMISPPSISASTSLSSSSSAVAAAASASASALGITNPTAPATEEAIRQFFVDVYDAWVKTLMNPFYLLNKEVKSSVFRARVAAAGKKYL